MIRLFVAVRPPPAIRDALIDTMDGIDGARWQDEEQLHLTLRFIGEVDRPVAEDVAAALARVDAPSFDLSIAGVGHFATKGRATALWARPRPSPELEALQHKVERACQQAGLPPERRKFTPHITLARLGRSAGPIGGWLAAHGALSLPPWRVDEFRLYESTLSPAGAQYEPVVRYPLQG